MIERIWGRHGAIFPGARLVLKWIGTAAAVILSVEAPFIVMALIMEM